MKKVFVILVMLTLAITFTSCATMPYDRYNTQKGAAIGAGLGAIGGQVIGRNTEGTLIGAAVGTLLGAIVGNATDQEYAAAREAAMTDKRVVYYDNHGGAVEAIPGPVDQRTDCRKVTKRVWNKGTLVSGKIVTV